jgi:hypothetical protein
VLSLNVILSQAHKFEDERSWAVYLLFCLFSLTFFCYVISFSLVAYAFLSLEDRHFFLILFVKDPSSVFRLDLYLRIMEMFLKFL